MCSSILGQRHPLRSPCLGGRLANRTAIWNSAPFHPGIATSNAQSLLKGGHCGFEPLPACASPAGHISYLRKLRKDELTPPRKSGRKAATDKGVTVSRNSHWAIRTHTFSPYPNKGGASNVRKQASKGMTATWRDLIPESCSISSAICTNARRLFGLRRGDAMLIGTFKLVYRNEGQ